MCVCVCVCVRFKNVFDVIYINTYMCVRVSLVIYITKYTDPSAHSRTREMKNEWNGNFLQNNLVSNQTYLYQQTCN